jgi:hypothetical protein
VEIGACTFGLSQMQELLGHPSLSTTERWWTRGLLSGP